MELTPDLLLRAYAIGVFPMAESRMDHDVYWIDPDRRGIIPLDRFHVPRRLRRLLRRSPFEVRCDTAFAAVIRKCSEPTPDRPDSWINESIMQLYEELFELGFAHSVETWQDDRLVGGLYGVAIGAAFFGESMFSRASNASKVALVHLVARLSKGGFALLDTQFTTRHLQQFGAVEISRRDYRRRLATALVKRAEYPLDLPAGEFAVFLDGASCTDPD
jgi:leucyl/phenylalanyl-tRNA--protein transferase